MYMKNSTQDNEAFVFLYLLLTIGSVFQGY